MDVPDARAVMGEYEETEADFMEFVDQKQLWAKLYMKRPFTFEELRRGFEMQKASTEKTTTNQLKRLVKTILERHGFVVWIQNVGQRGKWHQHTAFRGISDIIGYSPKGQFTAVECKNLDTGDSLSDEQERFLEDVKTAGGLAAVVSCKGHEVTWVWRSEDHIEVEVG